ncbi:MAG: Asp-tRNA(Asn)/Glu-tRNA(Gln) amidotransferase subunit GatA [candidate division Zixibacteria bacterium]|nr:Asp-tRNA(Asn)/Glu-tRNA(Gln) amidotransferase subunit GatA [candidate division Zixibacteria bacterium]
MGRDGDFSPCPRGSIAYILLMPEYKSLTAAEIAAGVNAGKLSAATLTEEALSLAKTEGKRLNAFITLCEEKALKQAQAIDREVREGGAAPRILAGVPVALKDNICYTDYETTCGSHILDKFIPPYDATCVTRLIEAGAVIIGKTNMDEFGMGSSNENSYFGPVKNPVNHELVPGGSSGGSAAAVAQGIVPIAYGSDTGGSIRQPAAFCGVYGLKPTYGSVSRYGLVAFGSSLDQIGPLARNARDLALGYQAICGRDDHDATSADCGHPDDTVEIKTGRKFKIGIPAEYFAEGLDPEVETVVRDVIELLEKAGQTFTDISLPLTDKAIAAYYIVANAEASSNLARYDGVRYGLREGGDGELADMYAATRTAGFGDEVKRRIMLGTYALSAGYYDAYYLKASRVRELIRRDFRKAFEKVDLIITPTTPTLAFRLGEKIDDPLAMYLSDVYTVPVNLAGIPAISVPGGHSSDGRPVGVQFTAPRFDELALFQMALCLERND